MHSIHFISSQLKECIVFIFIVYLYKCNEFDYFFTIFFRPFDRHKPWQLCTTILSNLEIERYVNSGPWLETMIPSQKTFISFKHISFFNISLFYILYLIYNIHSIATFFVTILNRLNHHFLFY